jgi:hypothetical protein
VSCLARQSAGCDASPQTISSQSLLCGKAWQKISGQVRKSNTSSIARQTKSFLDFWRKISLIIPQRHTNQGKKPFVDRTNRKVAIRTFTPAMFRCADCRYFVLFKRIKSKPDRLVVCVLT